MGPSERKSFSSHIVNNLKLVFSTVIFPLNCTVPSTVQFFTNEFGAASESTASMVFTSKSRTGSLTIIWWFGPDWFTTWVICVVIPLPVTLLKAVISSPTESGAY